jgi:hypothetical protein
MQRNQAVKAKLVLNSVSPGSTLPLSLLKKSTVSP